MNNYPPNELAGFQNAITKERINWADVRNYSTYIATALVKNYGLKADDTVSLFGQNTVWYPVEIAFKTGQSVAALLPTRYPGSEAAEDVNERLARATGWRDTAAGQVGSGQHLWALSTGDDRDLLSVRSLVFD